MLIPLPWRHYFVLRGEKKPSITCPHNHQRDETLNQIEPFTVFYPLTIKTGLRAWPKASQSFVVLIYSWWESEDNISVHDSCQARWMGASDCLWSSYSMNTQTNKTSDVCGGRGNGSNLDVPEARIHPWNSQVNELTDFLFA